jgi:hypothetical protein
MKPPRLHAARRFGSMQTLTPTETWSRQARVHYSEQGLAARMQCLERAGLQTCRKDRGGARGQPLRDDDVELLWESSGPQAVQPIGRRSGLSDSSTAALRTGHSPRIGSVQPNPVTTASCLTWQAPSSRHPSSLLAWRASPALACSLLEPPSLRACAGRRPSR